MGWHTVLHEVIQRSLDSDQVHTIALHTREQFYAAEIMAESMAKACGKHYLRVEFIVLPDSVRDIYPIGFIDPPIDLWK